MTPIVSRCIQSRCIHLVVNVTIYHVYKEVSCQKNTIASHFSDSFLQIPGSIVQRKQSLKHYK